MRDHSPSAPSVVVGIDGSKTSLDAALWAVDEAVSRDIPMRLVYAVDPDRTTGADTQDTARDLAAGEVALRYAATAIEATGKPVKIEVEILQAPPTKALREASTTAAMLCVGSMGLKQNADGWIGSTAAALACSAPCPVAIVRGHHPHSAPRQWVVAEVNESPASNGVLRRALEAAQLRNAPLKVLTTWQTRFTDIHDPDAVAGGNRLAQAQLNRRAAEWTKRYPDLDIQAVAVHGNTISYLTKNANSIQLLVIGHERAHGIRELVGPPGYAALHNGGCSVLICEPQNVM